MARCIARKACERLRIMIGALRVDLMGQILLENVRLVTRGVNLARSRGILLLQMLQHIRARGNLRCVSLERLQLVLTRRHHSLLRVG